MGKELQVFSSPEFGQVRIIEKDGEPWFVGKDVTTILGYQNGSRDINRHVDGEDRFKMMIFDGNQNKETIIINESGLYSLILSSKLPSAKAFKRWVTSEVIPAIRKHGGYLTADKLEEALSNPDVLIQLATQLKQERERNKELKAQADKLSHEKDYLVETRNNTTAAQMVLKRTRRTHNDYTITELAEVFDLSPTWLRRLLKDLGWLKQENGKGFHYPTLKAPQGALYIEVSSYFSKTSQTVRISPYGVLCIKQILKDKGVIPWYA